MVVMYDNTGKRIREGRIWPQGAGSVRVRRTAATREGAILAAGVAIMQGGSIPGVHRQDGPTPQFSARKHGASASPLEDAVVYAIRKLRPVWQRENFRVSKFHQGVCGNQRIILGIEALEIRRVGLAGPRRRRFCGHRRRTNLCEFPYQSVAGRTESQGLVSNQSSIGKFNRSLTPRCGHGVYV
jgi:hypothetical protein